MQFGGFLKTSLVDFPGRVASVIFCTGCNFRCGYCYNPQLVFSKTTVFSEEQILTELSARRAWVDAVVVTGGEPTVWPDLENFLRKLKALGLAVKLDTNGSNPGRLETFFAEGLVDYVAMDVKAPWSNYAQIAGACTPLHDVRQSVDLIKQSGVDYEFRTTLAPGLTAGDVEEIARQIAPAKRWFVQAFSSHVPVLDPRVLSLAVPDASDLQRVFQTLSAEMLFEEFGFRSVENQIRSGQKSTNPT